MLYFLLLVYHKDKINVNKKVVINMNPLDSYYNAMIPGWKEYRKDPECKLGKMVLGMLDAIQNSELHKKYRMKYRRAEIDKELIIKELRTNHEASEYLDYFNINEKNIASILTSFLSGFGINWF